MFKKTYLSREVSRALASMGEPVGDPFGGPAYGERRDPVTAIVAAFSAVAGGTAGIAAVATVVSTVGMGMTVVGAITGNKTLMKVGGFLSLAGGLTSLAAGAGLLGDAAAAEMASLSSGGAAGAAAAEQLGAGSAGDLAANALPSATESITAAAPGAASGVTDVTQGLVGPPTAPTGPATYAELAAKEAAMTPTAGADGVVKVAATPAPTVAPVTVPQVATTPAPLSTPVGTPNINTISTPMSDGIVAQASTTLPPGAYTPGAASVITPGVAPVGSSTDFFSMANLKNIFTGPTGGFAIMGASNLVGSAISGYAQGAAADKQREYQQGLIDKQAYARGYAGRVAA